MPVTFEESSQHRRNESRDRFLLPIGLGITRTLHRRDPRLNSSQITDILIAAECEGRKASVGSAYNSAQRTIQISKQVEAIMTTLPTSAK